MDITFLIADQDKPHEGVVRPFFNFAKGLKSKYEISFLLMNCSDVLSDFFEKSGFEVTVCRSKDSVIEEAKRINPKFCFADDDLKRLRLLADVKRAIRVKSVSYVQVLYGSHAIANCFDMSFLTFRQRALYGFLRYVPFFFFSERYAKLLAACDLVVANSKITASLLHVLYNVEVSSIVYPPIDEEIFKPTIGKERNEITVYLGSHLGDTRKDFVERIIRVAQVDGFLVNLFGNAKMAKELVSKGENEVSYHPKLSDIELARLYSKSKLTVCPQKWEQFGFVPVESMACGTPVVAFNCMGFQETVDTRTGWLANNEAEFLEILHNALRTEEMPFQDLRNYAIRKFSISASGKDLQNLLNRFV